MSILTYRNIVEMGIKDSDWVWFKCAAGHKWEEWANEYHGLKLSEVKCDSCLIDNDTSLDKLSNHAIWELGEEAGSANQVAWDGWRYSDGYPLENPYPKDA